MRVQIRLIETLAQLETESGSSKETMCLAMSSEVPDRAAG
jgi:hypothetical protein